MTFKQVLNDNESAGGRVGAFRLQIEHEHCSRWSKYSEGNVATVHAQRRMEVVEVWLHSFLNE